VNRNSLLLVSALVFVSNAPLSAQHLSAQRPDVLIVIADDVSESELNAVKPLPTLGRLQAEGIRITDCQGSPACSPARQGLHFGRWVGTDAGGCPPGNQPGAPDLGALSIAKMMNAAGYRTALFGKWHCGGSAITTEWQLAPHFHGFGTWRAGMPLNVQFCGGIDYWDWVRVDDGLVSISSVYNTTAIRNEASSWWTTTPSPKFAVVAFQAPHGPFHVPPASELPFPPPTGPTTKRQRFELMLQSFDYALEDLLSVVDRERTIVLVVSDNGTDDQVTLFPGKAKFTTFDHGINVVCIWRGPGLLRGAKLPELVTLSDTMATLAELIGIQPPVPWPEDVRSQSYAETLRSGASSPRSWGYTDYSQTTGERDTAVIERRFKLRRLIDAQGARTEELYDRVADPQETVNRVAVPDLAGELERLRREMISVN